MDKERRDMTLRRTAFSATSRNEAELIYAAVSAARGTDIGVSAIMAHSLATCCGVFVYDSDSYISRHPTATRRRSAAGSRRNAGSDKFSILAPLDESAAAGRGKASSRQLPLSRRRGCLWVGGAWRLTLWRIPAAAHIIRTQSGLITPVNLGTFGLGAGGNLRILLIKPLAHLCRALLVRFLDRFLWRKAQRLRYSLTVQIGNSIPSRSWINCTTAYRFHSANPILS